MVYVDHQFYHLNVNTEVESPKLAADKCVVLIFVFTWIVSFSVKGREFYPDFPSSSTNLNGGHDKSKYTG